MFAHSEQLVVRQSANFGLAHRFALCEHSLMSLKTFIARAKKKPAQFAREAGISRSYLSEILSGDRTPGRRAAEKIAKATKGQVSAAKLMKVS